MARKKAAREQADDPWAYYRSIQLTPEQKAEARLELERQSADAARDEVYAQFLALEGKVKFGDLPEDDD